MKPGIMRWNLQPLKCRATPLAVLPDSPVHSWRKFSAVRGATLPNSAITTRPAGSPPTVTSKKTLDVGVVSGGTSCAGRRGAEHPRGRRRKRAQSANRTSDFSKKSQVADVALASVTTTTR